MAKDIETILNKLVTTLTHHHSVRAIGLSGGERPDPEPDEGDIDLFVYCTDIPTRDERREMLASLREAQPVQIGKLEGGYWGQGDRLSIAGVETWLLYFTLAETRAELEAILAGQYMGRLDSYYYPIGRCAMWKGMRALFDPHDFLASLKKRLHEYPQELALAVIDHHVKALEDVEDLERAVQRKDLLFFHFALDLALDHFLQALFALNRQYFPSRKRSEAYFQDFKLKPAECEERLRQVLTLGGNAETLEQSYEIWDRLVQDLNLSLASERSYNGSWICGYSQACLQKEKVLRFRVLGVSLSLAGGECSAKEKQMEKFMMTDEPVVWHYGLMAERWAEFITEAREVPFFLQEIARYGQPVLDVACGTGRVLLPLLRAGIDMDGCDISKDMLHYCQKKTASEGFHPNLYNQSMHAFELPRKYKTIYICDSFGLAGGREKDLETLRRCHAHLEDGGALLVNIQAEYTSSESWEWWLCEKIKTLPQPWPEEGGRGIASDGSEHVVRFRLVDVDSLEQSFTRQVRLEKWQSGKLIASEEYTLHGDMYLKNELLLMLRVAGFRDVMVRGDYTDEPATSDHEEIVFIARK
jgi:SAM-dependent methyltransferase